jgi:hypothetical protein
MAHSREIIGVHYPSDSETSRVLARQLVNELFKNERFLKDLALVKKEWSEKSKETLTKPASMKKEEKKLPVPRRANSTVYSSGITNHITRYTSISGTNAVINPISTNPILTSEVSSPK